MYISNIFSYCNIKLFEMKIFNLNSDMNFAFEIYEINNIISILPSI